MFQGKSVQLVAHAVVVEELDKVPSISEKGEETGGQVSRKY